MKWILYEQIENKQYIYVDSRQIYPSGMLFNDFNVYNSGFFCLNPTYRKSIRKEMEGGDWYMFEIKLFGMQKKAHFIPDGYVSVTIIS